MRFNTLNSYNQTVEYRSWEPLQSTDDGFTYRNYAEAVPIKCRTSLNQVGTLVVFTEERLQEFGLLALFKDASSQGGGEGKDFLEESLYAIIRTNPLINPMGIVYGYYHNVKVPSVDEIEGALDRRVHWADLDQAAI